ncbi:MAG TPA: metallopeptidase TldD-related protein, partial [Nannocystaceae bacterium]|nr:metallopeptidase TldD-related protein [Nannocystaceae bacterium]
MTLGSAAARALCKRVLAEASFGDVRVHVKSAAKGDLRFAASRPTTSNDVERVDITVTASKDGRHASATGNRVDAAGLRELVQRAEAMALLAPVDPEAMPPLGRVAVPRAVARDRKVGAMTPPERAALVGAVLDVGKAKGLEMSGYLEHADLSEAFADRAGLFAYFDRTQLRLTCTARTPDGTGSSKAGFASHSRAGLSAKALAEQACDTALKSREPRPLPAGRYTVVLLPDAVAELLDFMVGAMGARPASEGRSFFAKKGEPGVTRIGETMFDPRVELRSDPTDRKNPAEPLAEDGRPHPKVTWVDRGVLRALHTTRFFAADKGMPSIPRPSSIHMAGEDVAVDALIAKVDKGVLVTRLWYNRMLDPRGIVATGLTRDGTFWIEGGKIAHSVKNLRYNDGPITLLTKLRALGRPQ